MMERVIKIDWEHPWSACATEPTVVANERSLHLIYFLATDDDRVGVAEFKDVSAHRLSSINDEVLHGHPLWGKGLEHYEAHMVENSRWIEELHRVHSVHDRFDPSRWRDRKHYLLCFHNSLMEVIAIGVKTTTSDLGYQEVLNGIVSTKVGA